MKARSWVFCLTCMAIGLMLFCVPQSRTTGQEASNSQRVKWEYTTELMPGGDRLNELGKDGWELVAVASKGPGDLTAMCYLKRRLP
jgi:hypothetical protein